MATSAFSRNFDLVKYYCCTICEKKRSVEIDAEFYCKKCCKYYCKPCIHSHRQHGWWFNKKSPYGKDKIMKWPRSKKMENYLITCNIHKNETITALCNGHSELCCSRCVELNHRGLILTSSCPKNDVPKLQHSHYISTGHVDGEGSLPRKPHRANEQCHCAKRDPSEKKDSGPYITLVPIQAPTAAIQPEPCELRGGGLPLQQPSQIIVWWHSASDVAQLGLHVQCILATAATVGSAVYNVWTTTFLQQFITTPSSVVGQPALSRAHLALRAVAVTLFSSCPAPCVSLVYSTVSMATKFATESLTSTQYSLWGKAMCP
ncbi:uncharacterized protein LOC127876560 isoform X2 [Dreissena polymorpha]|uniref:uncharacterized protein LOC127876560 isoform X2 n=1 Tax=Dreissena polymorpha TaxID=45954 RepID=UPI00226535E5|nr:uncharacterized protein LOC127876560 isoform X2 [Dreissena polymorpha]